jgi:hypothetical protein
MLSSLMGLPNPAWASLANVLALNNPAITMSSSTSESQDDDSMLMCLSKLKQ